MSFGTFTAVIADVLPIPHRLLDWVVGGVVTLSRRVQELAIHVPTCSLGPECLLS